MTQNTKSNKVALAVTSDHHGNSKLGLCPPVVQHDNGGTYHASRTQRAMWDAWLDYWEWVRTQAKGYHKVAIFNGDLGELDAKRRTYELIDPNKAVIENLLHDMLDPALKTVDRSLFIRGTQAHTGKSAWLEEAIASDTIGAIPSATRKVYNGKEVPVMSHYHFRGLADGVRFDAAHHVSVSGIPYRRNASADKVAFETWLQYIRKGMKPPNLVFRSHVHEKIIGDWEETRVLITPGWQMKTDFAYRVGRENEPAQVGGLLVLCDNGRYTYEYKTYEIKEVAKSWQVV